MTRAAEATLAEVAVPRSSDRVLVVSEDPLFIGETRTVAEAEGASVIACLGPAASPCFLDDKGLCPLAASCRVIIVESPPAGGFKHHLKDIAAGDYAERLQGAHPASHVLFIPARTASSGPTGEVAVVSDRSESLHLLTWILRALAISQRASERRNK